MIRKSKTKKINESLFIDSSILGLQELKDFCNEIIDAFDEEGISCDVEWHTNGTGDIYLLSEYESILVGRVVLVNEIETEKGTVYLVDHLSGETKRVGRFFGDSSFPNGVTVFHAHQLLLVLQLDRTH